MKRSQLLAELLYIEIALEVFMEAGFRESYAKSVFNFALISAPLAHSFTSMVLGKRWADRINPMFVIINLNAKRGGVWVKQ